MAKAFLSHSSAQKPFVERIYNALGRNNCVYDAASFEAGQRTKEEITEGIESSGLFVLFISEKSLESTWVKDEVRIAKNLVDDGLVKVLPFIIDKNIKHSDNRISLWLRNDYNLKYIENEHIIISKIKKALSKLAIEAHPIARQKNELFVGRNTLMSSFEQQFYLSGLEKPSAYIISGFNGIGRRTFLKNALIKVGLLKPSYEPISIFLNAKESIENAIFQLSDTNGGIDPSSLDIILASKEQKVKYLQDQVCALIQAGELLMVIDNGSVVQANRRLADWFVDFLNHPTFQNSVSICVISRFRAYSSVELEMQNVATFHVEAMVHYEIGALLVRYGQLFGLELDAEDVLFFSKHMNGMPEQIQYACKLIHQAGIAVARRDIKKIVEHGKDKVLHVVDAYQGDSKAINLLSLLADMEFVSLDYLYKIIGRDDSLETLLSEFYALGVYEFIGVNSGYIRMSYAISDYVRQSKFKIAESHRQNIRNELKKFLSGDLDTTNIDGSEILFNIRNAILNGHKLQDKYYIPAFVLKTVVELYNRTKYKDVISLADTSLMYKSISDESVVRELRYWLCMALARIKSERFLIEVKWFQGNAYHFLMGFNYRMHRELTSAEYEYKKVENSSSTFRRVQKELVNMYLEQRLYDKALVLAREIYSTERSNAFFIQSYFESTIRRGSLSASDILTIKELIAAMKENHSAKAANMAMIMDAEYKFYVDGDYPRAVEIINRLTDSESGNKFFALKALREFHRRSNNFPEVNRIQAELNKDGDEEYY